MVFTPMAHTVLSAIVLIHPILKSGKTLFYLCLIFLRKTVLIFDIESDKTAGGKIRTVLSDIDSLNSSFKIFGDKRHVLKIGILKKLRLIEHLGKLSVTDGGFSCKRLNEKHIVAELNDYTAKEGYKQYQGSDFNNFHVYFPLLKRFCSLQVRLTNSL